MTRWPPLATVIVFEVTVGRLRSMTLVDRVSVLSGWPTLALGVAMWLAVGFAVRHRGSAEEVHFG